MNLTNTKLWQFILIFLLITSISKNSSGLYVFDVHVLCNKKLIFLLCSDVHFDCIYICFLIT